MNEKYRIVYAVPPQGGARVAEIREDGRRLCALPGDYEVYPGHMDATSLERERRFNPFLQED